MMNVPPDPVRLLRNLALPFLVVSVLAPAQSNSGELRLKVTDPRGVGVKAAIELVSEAKDFRQTFITDESGSLIAKRLPFGIYRAQIQKPRLCACFGADRFAFGRARAILHQAHTAFREHVGHGPGFGDAD